MEFLKRFCGNPSGLFCVCVYCRVNFYPLKGLFILNEAAGILIQGLSQGNLHFLFQYIYLCFYVIMQVKHSHVKKFKPYKGIYHEKKVSLLPLFFSFPVPLLRAKTTVYYRSLCLKWSLQTSERSPASCAFYERLAVMQEVCGDQVHSHVGLKF